MPAAESEFNRWLRLRLIAASARLAGTPEPHAGVSFTASQAGSSHGLDLVERLRAGRRHVAEARLRQIA